MKKTNKPSSESKIIISPDTKKDVLVILIFALAFLSLLGIFDLAGNVGRAINSFWLFSFGWANWFAPIILLFIGYLIINKDKYESSTLRYLGLIFITLSFLSLLQLFAHKKSFILHNQGTGGGILGYLVAYPLEKIANFGGALIIIIALLLIGFLFYFETTFKNIFFNLRLPQISFLNNLKNKLQEKKEKKEIEQLIPEEIGFEQKEIEFSPHEISEAGELVNKEEIDTNEESGIPKKNKKHYPKIDIPLDLLEDKSSKPSAGDIKSNQEIIKKTLSHFNIDVEMGEVSVGPTVTQYTFKPMAGVKVAQITALANDLALALAAHPIRLEAPIPGKSLIGVEVPNTKIALVGLKEILTVDEFKKRKDNLMIALGKDVAGKPQLANLEKMPHLLVAGATNSGKTVCLNTIIISLLYQNQPDRLNFILIDPKQVEMTQYNDIPHLSCPVITSVKDTVQALRWSVQEMEKRFKTLAMAGKRNIDNYNETAKEPMPYLIIIVDELADLMSLAAADIEPAIIRLAQKARAVGIHLIVATQRPSVNVITGLIKANITSRVAFSVASAGDSRTILDHSGADKLLGRGDMLFISADLSKPKRIQGAYLSDKEIDNVVTYLKNNFGPPDYNEEITKKTEIIGVDGAPLNIDENDTMLEEAKEIIIKSGKASASYLQRRLSIGYARAARILDTLESMGVVSRANGAKPREILIARDDFEQDETLNELERAHEKLQEIVTENKDDEN